MAPLRSRGSTPKRDLAIPLARSMRCPVGYRAASDARHVHHLQVANPHAFELGQRVVEPAPDIPIVVPCGPRFQVDQVLLDDFAEQHVLPID